MASRISFSVMAFSLALAAFVVGCRGPALDDEETHSTEPETGLSAVVDESAQLTESTEPTESAQLTESTEPTESAQLTESTEPTESVQPIESTEPTESVQPIESTEPTESVQPIESTEPIKSTQREDTPSALHDLSNPEHPEPLVDLSEIHSVVRPDAIPALDDPVFEPAGEVDWLPQMEPVLVLEINGDVRAYPLRIMTWHEIVNNTVGGTPVTVSYCPLCNSAVVYDRRLGERILDFGTSGALLNSSLVMYDRQTESLWSHYTGQAVAGHLTGSQLDLLPVQIVPFKAFLSAYPQGRVLSFDTGHMRDYGRNPYKSYDDPDGQPNPSFFFGALDDRLAPMTRVVAVRGDEEGVVITYDVLAQRRVVPFTFEGKDLVAFYEQGTVSSLDTEVIAEGRDVGTSGVFIATANGQTLELAPSESGGFADSRTGLVFNILGIASDGSNDEVRLEPVEHLDTFWFAVSAFYPDARIIRVDKD